MNIEYKLIKIYALYLGLLSPCCVVGRGVQLPGCQYNFPYHAVYIIPSIHFMSLSFNLSSKFII